MQKLSLTKEILAKLISFPVLGGDSNLSIANYITALLESKQVKYHTVYDSSKTKMFIHAKIGPDTDGGVILSGHTDVVPTEGKAWKSDPFTLLEKDQKWFGRGSCDMKGFLACMLASIEMFQHSALKKPVYFAFSYDEEVGCISGLQIAESIRDFYSEKPQIALIGEPSMMHPVIGHKGICVIKTSIKGSAGHSSRILSEVSAVHVAARLVVWLENKMLQFVKDNNTDNSFYPNHTTMHVGKINGGVLANIIADHCEFYWDIRTIPKDSISQILDEYYSYCKLLENEIKERFSQATITNQEVHPPVPSLNSTEKAESVKLAQLISGNSDIQKVSYATEAGQFSLAGFDAVICGPGDIAQAHRANEFIAIEQIEKCLKMLENLADYLSS